MRYEPLGKYVSLSQGLVVNKSTEHLFADKQDDVFMYPLLRIVDFESNRHSGFSKYVTKSISDKVIIDEKTIVYTRVTCQCFRGFKGVVHNNLFIVKLINDEIVEDYLYTILQSAFVKKQALTYAQSSVVPDLTHEMFKSIIIPVPDRKVQESIASIYGSISEKIENNNAICSDLEGMAKLLYNYWFVQFDFPDEYRKPYKSSGGKMVWNEQLKREIPEGWVVLPLSNYLNCNQNTINQNNLGDCIAYLDTGSLTENAISQIQIINRNEGLPSRARRVVKENDILYSTVRPIQKHYGIIKHPVKNMIASTGFAVLSAKQGSSYNELFYLFITSEDNLRILDTIANNSVSSYPSINSDDILNLKIALPPDITCLKGLCGKLQNCYEMIDAKHKENKELEQLRDFLLPMLMNGQVKA